MARLDDWRPVDWDDLGRHLNREEERRARRLFTEIMRGGRTRAPRDPTEVDYARWCVELIDRIERDPLVQRYSNYVEFQRNIRNTEWWHAFGSQMLVARQFARGVTWGEVMADREAYARAGNPPILDDRIMRRADGKDGWGTRQVAWDFAQFCEGAMTYLWHENTRDAALWAPMVPHVVQPNAFPFDEMFFTFERDAWTYQQEYDVLDGGGKALVDNMTTFVLMVKLSDIAALLVWDQMLFPEGNYAPQVHFVFQPVYWDSKYPEDFEGKPYFDEIGNILRMLAFSQAPFLEPTAPQRLPRLIRRDYERAGRRPPEIKQVSVITLRARPNEPIYRNGTNGHEGGVREYQHSWWVRGHYRWQYYPSENTHKMIAIDQYMKQVGKPILKQLRDVSR